MRWPLMRRWLDKKSRAVSGDFIYNRVLLIDVRDSYFQSNPFDIIPLIAKNSTSAGNDPSTTKIGPNTTTSLPSFLVFSESEVSNIGKCHWNSDWIKDCFNPILFTEVASKRIINSGVTIGTADRIYEYLQLMEDIVLGLNKTELSRESRFPGCERNGVDQGVHNVIVHTHALGTTAIKMYSQVDGPVANMQAGLARVFDDATVTNAQKQPVAIAHQYDRDGDLRDYYYETVCRLPACLPICLSTYLPICLSAYLPICLSAYNSVSKTTHQPAIIANSSAPCVCKLQNKFWTESEMEVLWRNRSNCHLDFSYDLNVDIFEGTLGIKEG
jgi:hypothetical protein